jgi:hypothetical protein
VACRDSRRRTGSSLSERAGLKEIVSAAFTNTTQPIDLKGSRETWDQEVLEELFYNRLAVTAINSGEPIAGEEDSPTCGDSVIHISINISLPS